MVQAFRVGRAEIKEGIRHTAVSFAWHAFTRQKVKLLVRRGQGERKGTPATQQFGFATDRSGNNEATEARLY